MKFSLVDRITELQKGESISGMKNLSLAEEYLADHFPGFPVMPGVLMLESLVQLGAWLMRGTHDFQYSSILLKEAKALKFNNFLVPGKTLHTSCTIQKWDGNFCTLKGAGEVDGKSAVSAKITLEQFNLADKNPEMAENDAARIEALKAQFDQLTAPV